jgi:hypothetical protein
MVGAVSGKTFEVVNPATGAVIANVPPLQPLIFEQRPQQLGWGACCARHLSGDTWKPT